jgi:Peptidase U49
LQINGYGLETISEYTAILRYGRAPAGGFPAPLEALGIPRNALDNTDVNELALGHFVTARTFILLHEMGHILQARSKSISADPIQNEERADRFAATVMKRTPLRPLGMLVYFLADAHWSSYPASESDTHPLSGN